MHLAFWMIPFFVFICHLFLLDPTYCQEKGVVVESSTGVAPLPEGYYSSLHVLTIGINNYNHPAISDLGRRRGGH